MVVFLRDVAGGFDAEFAAHAEVDAEPAVARKANEDLLRRGLGAEEAGRREMAAQHGGISAAENLGVIMQEHAGDERAARGEVPALAVKFGFGELGHGGRRARAA